MMCEIQGPGGRYRLAEVVHGEAKKAQEEVGEAQKEGEEAGDGQVEKEWPVLKPGESVILEAENEVKELGSHVLIVSVAWELPEGRRTFQRFLKFTVTPPLAIKTRIQTSPHANLVLDPKRREEVSLEVLVQNTSPEAILFDRIRIEPVVGLNAIPIQNENDTVFGSLMPGDTRQYLFLVSPSPSTSGSAHKPSGFPPRYVAGTVLPLGRLDISWVAGPYRDPGRLQTSTLNRRVPITQLPTRTSSAAPPSPGPGGSGKRPPPLLPGKDDDEPRWEFDLTVQRIVSTDDRGKQREVDLEQEFQVVLRVGIRSVVPANEEVPIPKAPRLAVQYLSTAPQQQAPRVDRPKFSLGVSPPSRAATPLSPPFSPPPGSVSSRPMTPVSSQLRLASSTNLSLALSSSPFISTTSLPATAPPRPTPSSSFPPLPYLSQPPVTNTKRLPNPALTTGQVSHIGASLVVLDDLTLELSEENPGTTYGESQPALHWEGDAQVSLRFIALDEGLADLGGLRVLLMEPGEEGVGREWDSLGDVWVTD
ncbi:hypothetical protein BCR39DRAFT_522853 [Naematelia encephala]|uniref:Uncharacterized protein n=1 Tax=Naematelia encephala TaxID=71784 RepID=A0A1Y2BCJ6_9TREE|nr:hypothetical protein BCR39DRAFT_522853 [Naematelia encephala]